MPFLLYSSGLFFFSSLERLTQKGELDFHIVLSPTVMVQAVGIEDFQTFLADGSGLLTILFPSIPIYPRISHGLQIPQREGSEGYSVILFSHFKNFISKTISK